MLFSIGPGGADARACGRDVVMGEWTLTRAAWSDRHHHEELNYVLDGELHVTYGDETFVAHPGDVVIVPAGVRATYAAPEHARMVFVYGPPDDGHAALDTELVDLE